MTQCIIIIQNETALLGENTIANKEHRITAWLLQHVHFFFRTICPSWVRNHSARGRPSRLFNNFYCSSLLGLSLLCLISLLQSLTLPLHHWKVRELWPNLCRQMGFYSLFLSPCICLFLLSSTDGSSSRRLIPAGTNIHTTQMQLTSAKW